MKVEEVLVHDYLMAGIIYLFPKEYIQYCIPIYEEMTKLFSLHDFEILDLPTVKVHHFSEKELFGGKEHFVIFPGIIHVSDYPSQEPGKVFKK